MNITAAAPQQELTIKDQIINALKEVKRPGIDGLINFLETRDFFEAPCSTKHHLAVQGGLALHSFNVYRLLAHKVKTYKLDISKDTIAICGLCHDVCKINFYGTDFKNVKEPTGWVRKEVYVVKDSFPLGHGEKSVSILQDFIHLTPEEKLAIRWHMGAFEVGTMIDYGTKMAFNNAKDFTPLVTLLHTADFEASQILEKEAEE